VELTHRGVTYHFDYDFAPNDETNLDCPEWTPVIDKYGLEGSIHVHSITLNGRSRPVTTEVLAMMERAAAIKEFTTDVEGWAARYRKRGLPMPPRLLQHLEAVSRLEQSSVRPFPGQPQA
jgi:hypothetical protein